MSNVELSQIALVIAGMVFTAGLAASFAVPVFAADDYNSSRSNTSISVVNIPIANKHVGDILLRYGAGGAEINEVTDALARGISTADLKAMLVKFGVSDTGIQEVFTKLDELGAGDTPQAATRTVTDDNVPPKTGLDSPEEQFTTGKPAVFAPAAGKDYNESKSNTKSAPAGDVPQPATVDGELHRPPTKVSAPAAGDASQSTSQWGYIGLEGKALRDNFRENVKTTIGHVDHGKTARIAVAHGKGLRMLNRFRSAMARFDHILSRLESRIEKIKIEIEGEERAATGIVNSKFPPDNLVALIEKAKNMQVENEAKMEELKAKYESLLLGENAGGIAEEARAIAAELKTDIENLHSIIIEIYTQGTGYRGGVDFNSSRSNTSI